MFKRRALTNDKKQTPEQILTFVLMVVCFSVMLLCALVRLTNTDWLLAELTKIPIPSEFWQDRIMNVLFIFEMVFVYKILCRIKWKWCLFFSIIQTIIIIFTPEELYANILNLCIILLFPILCTRKLSAIIDSIFLYALMTIYGLLFSVGRLGELSIDNAYNFTYNVAGLIDYKLFIVFIYLFIKYNGGIKLWKTQKRLLLQVDLKAKKKKKEMLTQAVPSGSSETSPLQ